MAYSYYFKKWIVNFEENSNCDQNIVILCYFIPTLGPDAPTNYNYGRRRSRAVLYQLSGHYKNTEKSTKKIHSKLSTNVSLFPILFPRIKTT